MTDTENALQTLVHQDPPNGIEEHHTPWFRPSIQQNASKFILSLPLLGLILLLLRGVIFQKKIAKIKHKATRRTCIGRIEVIESKNLYRPFATGFLKPTIFLPANLDEPRRKTILRHEFSHIQEKHLLWQGLSLLNRALLFANPITIIDRRIGQRLMEDRADCRVSSFIGAREYARVLYSTALEQKRWFPLPQTALAWPGKGGELTRRINMILNEGFGTKAWTAKRIIGVVPLLIAMVMTTVVGPLLVGASERPERSITGSDSTGVPDGIVVETPLTELILESGPSGSPLPQGIGVVTLPFGIQLHPFTGEDFFHRGVDIGAPRGTVLSATMSGKVVEQGSDPDGKGLFLTIESGNWSIHFSHLSEFLVHLGETVALGDAVARVGNTGVSTGPHVHYEVREEGIHLNPQTTF